MSTKVYEKINPIGEFDELKIHVDYQKGGISFWDYKPQKRGVYVHLTPVHRDREFEHSAISGDITESGFKILVSEIGRRSQKAIDSVCERVLPISKDIARMYDERRFNDIVKAVR